MHNLQTLSLALSFFSVLPTISAAPTSRLKRDTKFPFGSEKVRGVNLGGWFVLEPWITPSIFEPFADSRAAVDEYTFTQTLGKDEAYSQLSQHWSSWITEADFYKIKSKGLNHVRIPIGYWSVAPIEGDPYVQGAYDYLGAALDWAAGAGLYVMIDLHGAPGSQNGFDNSGKAGDVTWTQGDTIAQTHAALNKLRDDFAAHSAVSSIELLNEPMGPQLDRNTLNQFYMDGWGDLYDQDVGVVFHDAFEGVNDWNDFGDGKDKWVLDTHHYEVFDSNQLSLSPGDHVSSACDFGKSMATNNKPTISGEWTGAMTDCAKWLNGLGVGARYDGTFAKDGQTSYFIGSCDGLSTGSVDGLGEEKRQNIARFIEVQMDAYERAAGWVFWTWKTESAPEWDFQALSDAGVIPSPVTNRNYPGQCS